jgi:Domain of unknown function (DUF4404)
MSRETLRDLLNELHARLSNASTLDPDVRKLLTTVSHDIEHALAHERRTTESPKERVEELAVRFEGEHPALADVLRQIVDALAKAGI